MAGYLFKFMTGYLFKFMTGRYLFKEGDELTSGELVQLS